jgi:tRNA-dihydrouridine synthase
MLEMRAHFCFYTRGIPGGSKVRDLINHTEDEQEIMQAIDSLFFHPGGAETDER